ncbi:MAG: uracil-DNA glycosylase [Planctomycetota bacterium]
MTTSEPRQTERDRLLSELKARVELEKWFGADLYPVRAAGRSQDPDQEVAAIVDETAADKQARLDELFESMKDCHSCPLAESRNRLVFGEGNPDARLVFVGEAPGREEDRQGRPFVGRAGRLLTKMIHAMGLEREDVYIGNILKCRPPENRTPTLPEMATCMPYIVQQIEIIEPEVICALGATALKGLLRDPKASIGRLRGRFTDWRGTKLMPTYHPAYLLRSPDQKRKAWEDLQAIMAELGLPVPEQGA